jgi:hypothetical protein
MSKRISSEDMHPEKSRRLGVWKIYNIIASQEFLRSSHECAKECSSCTRTGWSCPNAPWKTYPPGGRHTLLSLRKRYDGFCFQHPPGKVGANLVALRTTSECYLFSSNRLARLSNANNHQYEKRRRS